MNALTLGLIAALCWGIHDVTIRRISQTAPLMATLLGVLVVGAAFQVVVMAATGSFTALPQIAVIYSVLAGIGFLLASVCLYNAFHRGPVRIVAPVIGSYPVLSVAFASFRGENISPVQWAAVLAVVAGIAIVSTFSADEEDADIPAVLPTIALSALSAIGFFATFAFGQEAAKLADDLPSILITRITSIALLLPAFPLLALPWLPGRGALVFIAIMGVLDGIALLCVISAGSLPSAQYAAVASSTFGMITIILAWIFLREKLTPLQWLGCAVAFGGIGVLAL